MKYKIHLYCNCLLYTKLSPLQTWFIYGLLVICSHVLHSVSILVCVHVIKKMAKHAIYEDTYPFLEKYEDIYLASHYI
jgi:hypothetical protein